MLYHQCSRCHVCRKSALSTRYGHTHACRALRRCGVCSIHAGRMDAWMHGCTRCMSVFHHHRASSPCIYMHMYMHVHAVIATSTQREADMYEGDVKQRRVKVTTRTREHAAGAGAGAGAGEEGCCDDGCIYDGCYVPVSVCMPVCAMCVSLCVVPPSSPSLRSCLTSSRCALIGNSPLQSLQHSRHPAHVYVGNPYASHCLHYSQCI